MRDRKESEGVKKSGCKKGRREVEKRKERERGNEKTYKKDNGNDGWIQS